MKRYIAVLEIEDDEEIIDASVSYSYSYNGMNYKATERMELKEEEESEDARNKTYEDGLNEAWELARDIVCLPVDGGRPSEWLEITFGSARTDIILRDYSALEAIKQAKHEEKIKVGDEVESCGAIGVVVESPYEGAYDNEVLILWANSAVVAYKKQDLKKTGRHFSQIEEIIMQMQEGMKNGNEDN